MATPRQKRTATAAYFADSWTRTTRNRIQRGSRQCLLGVILATICTFSASQAGTIVYPNANADEHGATYDNVPMHFLARTHLIIVASSELAPLRPGDDITGLTWRVDSGPALPGIDLTFQDYDVFFGQAAVSPSSIATILEDNYIAGTRTQSRSGPLTILADSFPAQTSSDPAAFGMEISLIPYTYQGGDLVIELTHSGSGQWMNLYSPRLDGIRLPSNQVNAVYSGGYAATTGSQDTSVAIGQLHFEMAGRVPEPSSMLLCWAAFTCIVFIHRRD